VEQVLTATAHEPGPAVLGGLHIEANGEALALMPTTPVAPPQVPPARYDSQAEELDVPDFLK
ncbi:hypothetical protein ABZ203_25595, partial [Streptomyces albidoflavus]